MISSPELSDRATYSYAAVATNVSRLIFTAGACPIDTEGSTVSVGGVRGQTEKVMDNLEAALRAAGAELTDVVKTTVYVATDDRDDLDAAWEVVNRRFGDHDPPSTLLGVSVLGYRDQLVEVEAVAIT
jgi:enamine deaminase RidA (YjgF/YER057c/UK114 family)